MLTFEEKLAIIESFPQLHRKDVSLGRVNFHFEESSIDKKNVVYHLHPNGNGFVYAEHIPGYKTDEKGMVNIRDLSADALRMIIQKSIEQLSADSRNDDADDTTQEETWMDKQKHTLVLRHEETWNIYAGDNLDSMFRTYKEAEEYLLEEGFRRRK